MTMTNTEVERVVQAILDKETAVRFQQFVDETKLSRSAAGKLAIKKFLDHFFMHGITNVRIEQTSVSPVDRTSQV